MQKFHEVHQINIFVFNRELTKQNSQFGYNRKANYVCHHTSCYLKKSLPSARQILWYHWSDKLFPIIHSFSVLSLSFFTSPLLLLALIPRQPRKIIHLHNHKFCSTNFKLNMSLNLHNKRLELFLSCCQISVKKAYGIRCDKEPSYYGRRAQTTTTPTRGYCP